MRHSKPDTLTEVRHHACALNIPICPTSTTMGSPGSFPGHYTVFGSSPGHPGKPTKAPLYYNITHNITAVSAEELGMVAADGRTKANHHFKFRAMGAVTAQLDRLSPAPFQNGTDCQLLQLMQYLQHRSSRN